MKKWKYLMAIIVIGICVFIGIEVFRKENNNQQNNNDISTQEIAENTQTNQDTERDIINNAHLTQKPVVTEENIESKDVKNEEENTKTETLKNGEELMEKAKTITASGWAGASNNVIGLKDNILYYYNKGTGEFDVIAEGVEDIYSKTEHAEEITAKGKRLQRNKRKTCFCRI